MNAARGIIKDLYPPGWMSPDDSSKLDDDALGVTSNDRSALEELLRGNRGEAEEDVNDALAEKHKLLATLATMSTSPCTEATNVTYPFAVNGTTQAGEPQVQFFFSCDEKVKQVELDTPGQTISSCDGDGHPCAVKNGNEVIFKPGDMKKFDFTISGKTLGSGQEAQVEEKGDIVPIVGDSSNSFQDEVM